MLQVVGEVDRGHPALADFALDGVTGGEGGGETGELGVRCQGSGYQVSGVRCQAELRRIQRDGGTGNQRTGGPALASVPSLREGEGDRG